MDKSEIMQLLNVRGEQQQVLFSQARSVRFDHHGNKAIIRGVIEITNSCQMNCLYCPMRRDNPMDRYLMTSDQILEAAASIRGSGIGVVFLQGGEIPATTQLAGRVIPELKKYFHGNVEIILCLGNKTRSDFAFLKNQGAHGYILKHETCDPQLFMTLRQTTLADRLACMKDLMDLGYHVGTGNIIGLPGQSPSSIAEDILLAVEYGTHMVSCAPFICAPDTPLASQPSGDIDLTLNTMALMRILNPMALIPAVSALEKIRPGGQVDGFNAGANVITVNFTPAREKLKYEIYGKNRFSVSLKHAQLTLEAAGLHI